MIFTCGQTYVCTLEKGTFVVQFILPGALVLRPFMLYVAWF